MSIRRGRRRALAVAGACLWLVAATGRLALAASSPGDVSSQLGAARQDKSEADGALADVKARLQALQDRYDRVRAKADEATRDVIQLYAGQQELESQLRGARLQFNDRVSAAYEAGPGLAVGLFLGMTSMSDLASVQEYTAHAMWLDTSDVADLTDARAQLVSVTSRLERRQGDLFRAQDELNELAVAMSAEVEAAQEAAAKAGQTVTKLEREQQQYLDQQAAMADSLDNLERSGIVGSGCDSGTVHNMIVDAFTPLGQDQVDYALYIANRESRCNPNAWNPTVVPPYGNAAGVFQILYPGIWEAWTARCGHVGDSPFNAQANVDVTACIVEQQGWGAWAL
jgi:peptidoglycan hydrolase CwlO-like protein